MFKPINGWTKTRILNTIENDFTVKSLSEQGACAYRGAEGAKCAVGLFIPDEVYDLSMEGNSVSDIVEFYAVDSMMPLELEAMEEFQKIHDGSRNVNTKSALLRWVNHNVA